MLLNLTRIELPFWIYWICCGLVSGVLVLNWPRWVQLLEPPSVDRSGPGYVALLIFGWLSTLGTGICYVLFTQKLVNGPYQVPDLVTFSCVNGILEQGMFIFWFILGLLLAERLRITRPIWRFTLGFVSYSLYSGLIHSLFWSQFLPDHIPAGGLIVCLLLVMSGIWMGLVWRYQAIVSIVLMHIVVDFITVGHLHFHWFEGLSLS